MNQKTREFRQKIADSFLQVLNEKQLHWKIGWNQAKSPVNAYTGKKYRGINKFGLYMAGLLKVGEGETPDNRWATFKQIQNKGWKLKKGAIGVKVEYWQPYDFEKKLPISWSEFYKRKTEEGINLIAKYYTVFNGRDIIGIPELEQGEKRIILEDSLIDKIASGMQVKIYNDGGSEAYYSIDQDQIHLPQKESFLNTYEYNATALHELSHATGAEKRLNRDMKNQFGTEAYAYEELVAEISSCFMGEHLELAETEEHLENHKAYVQSWIQHIGKDANILIRAIKDAEDAANYLEYYAGILSQDKYLETLVDKLEVSENKIDEEVQTIETKSAGTSEPTIQMQRNIKTELHRNGYKPTAMLIQKIEKLNQITGKSHSLVEIHDAFFSREYQNNPAANKILGEIEKCLQNQEALYMRSPIAHPFD